VSSRTRHAITLPQQAGHGERSVVRWRNEPNSPACPLSERAITVRSPSRKKRPPLLPERPHSARSEQSVNFLVEALQARATSADGCALASVWLVRRRRAARVAVAQSIPSAGPATECTGASHLAADNPARGGRGGRDRGQRQDSRPLAPREPPCGRVPRTDQDGAGQGIPTGSCWSRTALVGARGE
jgi:hypothetical protein